MSWYDIGGKWTQHEAVYRQRTQAVTPGRLTPLDVAENGSCSSAWATERTEHRNVASSDARRKKQDVNMLDVIWRDGSFKREPRQQRSDIFYLSSFSNCRTDWIFQFYLWSCYSYTEMAYSGRGSSDSDTATGTSVTTQNTASAAPYSDISSTKSILTTTKGTAKDLICECKAYDMLIHRLCTHR